MSGTACMNKLFKRYRQLQILLFFRIDHHLGTSSDFMIVMIMRLDINQKINLQKNKNKLN